MTPIAPRYLIARQAKRAGRRQRREGAKQPHTYQPSYAVGGGAQRLEGRGIWIKTGCMAHPN